MTYPGLIGNWPAGPDFEASTPVLWPPIDRKLAQLGMTVQSAAERADKIPAPGTNERWTVRCPPLSLTWTWDGLRWLTWDDRPVTYQGYWYDGDDGTGLSTGTGGQCTGTYQRRGYWCDATLKTVLGSEGGNVGQGGSEKWYWYLQYQPLDMYQVGTARVRLADTREWAGTVGLINWNRVYVAINGARLNKDVVPWTSAENNEVLMQMTYLLKL